MENQYIIKGGTPLNGEVTIGGAKNAALGILAAAIMADETVVIDNLPNVRDINVLLTAIESIGATVKRIGPHVVSINGSTINDMTIDYDSIRKIRASYYLLGALLGKYKKAQVALPGGCEIGSRPIDLHLKGFRALGATVSIEHGMINTSADELVGNHIFLDTVSVGATINIMLAACMAEGKTVIENAAKEPHIVDVANFLNSMGANIKGAGTDKIRMTGVTSLHASEYSIIPDQIEAGTFMVAAAATRGDVLIKNVIPKHLEAISVKLMEIGATVEEFDDAIRVTCDHRLGHTQIKTLPYPGFPTDMQPQLVTFLTTIEGTSMAREGVWDNRFRYVNELKRMGADIRVEGKLAIIDGVNSLIGAHVKATDLRAGAAMIIAGLMAEGTTEITDIYHIDRGYENFEEKFVKLGGSIERVQVVDDLLD